MEIRLNYLIGKWETNLSIEERHKNPEKIAFAKGAVYALKQFKYSVQNDQPELLKPLTKTDGE